MTEENGGDLEKSIHHTPAGLMNAAQIRTFCMDLPLKQ